MYKQNINDEEAKEIAWNHINYCGKCDKCSPGTNKIVFGKKFNNVCSSTMAFGNPNRDTLECIKKLLGMKMIAIDNIAV